MTQSIQVSFTVNNKPKEFTITSEQAQGQTDLELVLGLSLWKHITNYIKISQRGDNYMKIPKLEVLCKWCGGRYTIRGRRHDRKYQISSPKSK